MITVYYLLDKREAYKRSKDVPLLADVKYDHNGRAMHFRFAIGLTCNPKNFNKQNVLGREPNAETKNLTLQRITRIAEKIYLEGIEKGQLPDMITFKAKIKAVLTDVKTERTTLDYLRGYLDHLKTRGKSKATLLGMERLQALLEGLQAKGTSIHLDNIDLEFETAMLKELQAKKFNTNTQGSYIKRLKMFLNHCVKNNVTRNLIFKQFQITEEAGDIVALSETEVEAIAKLDLPKHKYIEKGAKLTRDWFIVSTQTGLRYSDLWKVSEDAIKQANGGYDLHITQQKTGNKVVIPVSRLLYKILKEYNFSLPDPCSNQKYNENLKEIIKKAKITKDVTSHTGRKTFCTMQYRKGVPVPLIMKISGHRTEKDFYKYIGVDLTENASMVRATNEEFRIDFEPKMKVS